jgi:hypothetical protein
VAMTKATAPLRPSHPRIERVGGSTATTAQPATMSAAGSKVRARLYRNAFLKRSSLLARCGCAAIPLGMGRYLRAGR